MNKESFLSGKLKNLGVSAQQINLLENHLNKAEGFVVPVDPGIEQGMDWLWNSLDSAIKPEEAQLLYKIALENKPNPEVQYLEKGYDSCQSHRKIAKVVGEAILLGGLIYEAGLLGLTLEPSSVQDLIDCSLEIEPCDFDGLVEIAKKYGSKQDFIFPGVTPSSPMTPSLNELAVLALSGEPPTTVRTLTGVGGKRNDKDWNYAADLATFVKLKVEEDKRYYHGLGIFYFLMEPGVDSFPALDLIKEEQPKVYAQLSKFVGSLKSVQKQEIKGVSILCSSYLPQRFEIRKALAGLLLPDEKLELAEAFHSPAYEFIILKSIFEQVQEGVVVDDSLLSGLPQLERKLKHWWSFYSTIHLPWTAELAGLAGSLMGRITNQEGNHCIRYGVGYEGKAVEIREYHLGQGGKALVCFFYPRNGNFDGSCVSFPLTPNHPLWAEIEEYGLMRTAITFLERQHE